MTAQHSTVSISPLADIVAEMKAGRMVILVDEEDRENEGDLVLAADHVTPEAINFMARFGRGLICLTLTRPHCEHLKLPPMVERNGTVYSTAFTVSIEAAQGVTTGISAADRARTVQVAVAKNAKASDLVQPGHIFPLQAVDGGVLMRAGHTEAGCDLAAMAGCSAASVICEIMKDDGTMARLLDDFRRRAWSENWHHRRPDRVPQPHRVFGHKNQQPSHDHCTWRIQRTRLQRPDQRQRAHGLGARQLERRSIGIGSRA